MSAWSRKSGSVPDFLVRHDREWGVPVRNERKLFEFLLLEGAQAAEDRVGGGQRQMLPRVTGGVQEFFGLCLEVRGRKECLCREKSR